jgi:predicted RNA-binding protein YlqC (UPF0109 family)
MTAAFGYDVLTDTESPVVSMLTHLIGSLVDRPDRIYIYGVSRGDDMEFVAEVESVDLGKFSGRNARTAQSLRVIVRTIGTKDQRNFFLSIVERPPMPVEANA